MKLNLVPIPKGVKLQPLFTRKESSNYTKGSLKLGIASVGNEPVLLFALRRKFTHYARIPALSDGHRRCDYPADFDVYLEGSIQIVRWYNTQRLIDELLMDFLTQFDNGGASFISRRISRPLRRIL